MEVTKMPRKLLDEYWETSPPETPIWIRVDRERQRRDAKNARITDWLMRLLTWWQ